MTQLCSYTVRADTGLAPNPYWGWCTMAVCTPNHQGINLEAGDWIVGFLDKAHGNRFLYAMQVGEVLHRDAYFQDPRFNRKKPVLNGASNRRCGDNMYFLRNGIWHQLSNPFHGTDMVSQDTRHAKVYVAHRFIYLGRCAASLPSRFAPLVHIRGCKKAHSPSLVKAFLDWITSEFAEGMHAPPLHGSDTDQGCRPLPETDSDKKRLCAPSC